MGILRLHVYFVISVWMAVHLVNWMNIIPYEIDLTFDPIGSSEAQSKIIELKTHFEDKNNFIDYFSIILFMVREGLALILSTVISLFTIYRDIMIAFGIPEIFANIFQIGINFVLLYEIGAMLRGGR